MRPHSRWTRRAVICTGAALWLAWPSAAGANELPLRFYTEEYPPVSFAKDGKAAGLASEVVQEIQQHLHTDAPIEVVPWARGYRYATTEPNVGLFATTRTSERESLFKWVGPISATVGQLYVRRGSRNIKSLDDARRVKRILVPREWYLHQILREMGFHNLEPVAAPADALRMLSAGRGDAAALDDVTVAESAIQGGVAVADIDRGPLITHAVQYIAFSQGTPDELVARWQATLDAMRQDGSFERIFKRWLPGSPLPPLR